MIKTYPPTVEGQDEALATPEPRSVVFDGTGYTVTDGEDYVAPLVVGGPVTRRQMLTALHRIGLLPIIKEAVAASDDVELQIAFDESQEFETGNAFISAMAQALGKTQDDVDAIFALARTI